MYKPYNFLKAMGGLDVLGFHLASLNTKLVQNSQNFNKKSVLVQLSRKFSSNPAKLLNLKDRGKIKKGHQADLVVFDMNYKWQQ